MNRLFFLISLIGECVLAAQVKFIALGDVPYELPKDEPRFVKMLEEINHIKPTFAIHVGDIKASSVNCSDKNLSLAFEKFLTVKVPLIYTPGDNEWTDCYRKKAGGYDPLERLNFLRALYFPDEFSLGQTKIKVTRQSSISDFKKYVENAHWAVDEVGFVSIHIVGSNNGLEDKDEKLLNEFNERNQANLFWLNEAFKQAREKNQKAVVIFMHGDPQFTSARFVRTGYKEITEAFLSHSNNYKKPILLIHGDSHEHKYDKVAGFGNFTQLIVPGAPRAQAVEVAIDTSQVEPFQVKLLTSF